MGRRRRCRGTSPAPPVHLAILLVFGLFLLPLCAFARSFRVSGTVFDPTHKPVTGASVELSDSSGSVLVRSVTDSMGSFQLTTDSAGEYQLVVFDPSPFSEVTGVRIPSYASVSFTYHFNDRAVP